MPSFFRFCVIEVVVMRVLAVDQARHGAWAIFNYEDKSLIDYGSWNFDSKKYKFEKAMLHIEVIIKEIIHAHSIDAVYFEDIQMRKNVQSFKRLAQLQGVLVNMCEKNEYLYGIVAPSSWQSYCKARGRTSKEIKDKVTETEAGRTKVLSLQFVKEKFGVDTDNDNVSDAICIGHYVVNNIDIPGGQEK